MNVPFFLSEKGAGEWFWPRRAIMDKWTQLCRLLEHGQITRDDLVGCFLDDIDVANVEQELRSLPEEFFEQLRAYLLATPRSVPAVSWYGASPAQFAEALRIRAERAALVRVALEKFKAR